MGKKPKVEYRLVCARHGKDSSHRTHAYVKSSLAKAEQAKIDADHKSEMAANETPARRNFYYAGEGPWRIEMRVVSAWGALDDGEALSLL